MDIETIKAKTLERAQEFRNRGHAWLIAAGRVARENDYYAVYIPFVGWIYAMAFLFDDEFIMKHTRQAFIAALIFTLVPVALSFIKLFSPASLRVLRLIGVILIYLSHALYLSICVWGTIMIHRKKFAPVPVIEKYAKRLDV